MSQGLSLDIERLRKLYWEEEMSLREVAAETAVSYDTIRNRFHENEIPVRDSRQGGVEVADESRLRELYRDESLSTRDIGEKFGVSQTTVRRRMEKYDIPLRDRRVELPDEPRLRKLYWDEGLSTYDLAEKFGVSQNTVIDRMEENGIPRRDVEVFVDPFELDHLYWNKQMSAKDVADELGLTRQTIHRKMNEYGIPTRESGVRTP
jgi:DNA-binding transcriptional regulator LsrR (DeoR family)